MSERRSNIGQIDVVPAAPWVGPLLLFAALAVCMLHAPPAEAFCDPNVTCNANGTCLPDDNCSCFVGFSGASCDQCAPNYYDYPQCTFCETSSTCTGNGTCGPTGACECSPGWTGTSCSEAVAGVPALSRGAIFALIVVTAGLGGLLLSRRGDRTTSS